MARVQFEIHSREALTQKFTGIRARARPNLLQVLFLAVPPLSWGSAPSLPPPFDIQNTVLWPAHTRDSHSSAAQPALSGRMGAKSSCLAGVAFFLQLCAAVAIIVITALKLNRITLDLKVATLTIQNKDTCLLGPSENGVNLCYFAYAVSGISIIATGILSILQCCTCHLCGLGGVLDAIFAAVGTAVWAVAGVVFLHYDTLHDGWPLPEWRKSIPALSFVACALFGIMCLASIWSMMSACCKGRRRGGKGVY